MNSSRLLDLGKVKATLEPRSFVIATFALCGFANLSSIAIQIGGIGALAPSTEIRSGAAWIESDVRGYAGKFHVGLHRRHHASVVTENSVGNPQTERKSYFLKLKSATHLHRKLWAILTLAISFLLLYGAPPKYRLIALQRRT